MARRLLHSICVELSRSEVLERVLADHAALRALLDRLEDSARGTLQGRRGAEEALRADVPLLDARLRKHLQFEDDVLLSALADSDAWSEERVERVTEDHARQREILDLWGEYAVGRRSTPMLALAAWGLVHLLREDMAEEERVNVNEDVLKDDPTNPFMETD